MNNKEIKEANRKALPKFILIMVICAIIGGTFGFFSAKYGINELADNIKTVGALFGMYIAPWLMLIIAVIVPVISIPIYKKAKKLLSEWDGENEEIYEAVDKNLSIVIWITSAALITSYFLIAASYAGGFAMFESKETSFMLLIAIIAFFAIMVESTIIQQKCVDTSKKTNPEKTASVYDIRFHKKWIESCDEAEKILIGKCAFKAYGVTNTACTLLAIILAVCALVFDIGFLPSLVVCLIWIINQSVYCKEALKYSKSGNRLS